MGLCGNLIESKTKECTYKRKHIQGDFTRMWWVQPGNQRVGDQVFDAFAYCDEKSPRQRYIMSWKDTSRKPSNITRIWTAVVTTATGFVCQFLGLRACHSSVAVVQLGVTVIMSLARAGLRTQRLREEDKFLADDHDLVEGHELDCLAILIGRGTSKSGQFKADTTKAQPHCRWLVCSDQTPR